MDGGTRTIFGENELRSTVVVADTAGSCTIDKVTLELMLLNELEWSHCRGDIVVIDEERVNEVTLVVVDCD